MLLTVLQNHWLATKYLSLQTLTERENDRKHFLKYKANDGTKIINCKRKHQDSSNFKNFSKTQKSTETNLGQMFKSSSTPRKQNNYKLQQNKHNYVKIRKGIRHYKLGSLRKQKCVFTERFIFLRVGQSNFLLQTGWILTSHRNVL